MCVEKRVKKKMDHLEPDYLSQFGQPKVEEAVSNTVSLFSKKLLQQLQTQKYWWGVSIILLVFFSAVIIMSGYRQNCRP